MVKADVREQVRQRANFACENCGTSETDVGGQLTIDHFRPRRKAGDDSLDNLIYCCVRCNQYKLDYWPKHPDELCDLLKQFVGHGLKAGGGDGWS